MRSGSEDRLKQTWAAVYIVMTAVCWSTMGVLYKFISWQPLAIGCLRGVISGSVCLTCCRSLSLRLNGKILIGALFSFAANTLFIYANKMTTAGNAIILQYTNPIFVLLVMWLFFKQPPQKNDVIMLVVSLTGIVLFFVDDIEANHMAGNILALTSGLFLGLGMIWANRLGEDPIYIYIFSGLISILVGAPQFIAQIPTAKPAEFVAAILVGVVACGFPNIFFSKGIRFISPTKASIILMLDPVLNTLWVALAYHELPGALSLLGGAMVIFGTIFWLLSGRKKAEA